MAPQDDNGTNYKDSMLGLTPASTDRPDKLRHVKPITRSSFTPQEFERMVEDQGCRIRITPSVICPNRTSVEDTNHALDCPICNGSQVVDLAGSAIEEWGVIQGIKFDKKLDSSIFDLKDCTITVKAKTRLYYWYKIEVLHFSSIFNQVVKRGTGDKDVLRYPPALNSTDTPYHLIANDGTIFVRGTDYEIEAPNKLKWLGVNRPAAGKLYSVSYPILPTFRVLEMLHENRYYYVDLKQTKKIPVQLPQQALIRWDYLAGKGTSPRMENP